MDVGLVCDACSALTPIGVPQCARCGQPVALDPRPRRSSKQPSQGNGQQLTAPAGTPCKKCGTNIPPNFKFCPSCGVRVVAAVPQNFEIETRVGPRTDPASQKQPQGRSTLFFGGAVQSARAKLTLIRG